MSSEAKKLPAETSNAATSDKELNQRMRASADATSGDSNTRQIMAMVSEESYAKAIKELRTYLESHPEFPKFKERSERYISYAIDLVNGIKAKRTLAAVPQLASAKQQELHERALAHFNDLEVTLAKVVQIEREVKLEDIRSTVWVVKAAIHCLFAILVLAFLLDLSSGVLHSATLLADNYFGQIVDTIFDKLGM